VLDPAASALLAETRRKPARLLLTGVAVLVATVFAAGTLLLSATLDAYVASRAVTTPTGAAAVVRSGDVAASTIAAVPGVASAVEFRTGVMAVTGAGTGTGWEVQSDPMTGPLSRLSHGPVAGSLPVRPDQVVIGRSTAERTGAGPGTRLTITGIDGTPVPVTVTAVAPVLWDGTDIVIAMPATVAALGGTTDQIDVAATPGTGEEQLAERIGAAVGDPGAVTTGAAQRATELATASSAATAVLLGVGVFAGLAVVAAAIVVASTFRIVLTQRRTQLALLRCIGARRGQLIGAVLAEAALSGLVAGLLGVAVAVAGGVGVLQMLAVLGGSDLPALAVSWPAMGACVAMAVGTTVVAALAPAAAAARIPPVAALGSAAAGETGAPDPRRRAVSACVLAAIAVVIGMLGAATGGIVIVAASGLVAFAAVVAAGPLLVVGLAATAGRLVARIGGAAGRLAVANSAQVPRRTAATISVLALGAGLTASLLVAIASGQADAQARVARQVPAAVAIRTDDPARLAATLRDDPQLVVHVGGSTVLVDPAPGVAPDRMRAAVDDAVRGQGAASVQYAADVRAELDSTIGIVRLIGLALVGMTLLVAIVGVGITLMLSVTERVRETGLLRALGLSRPGVRAMVAWEAALGGTGAAVLGTLVGVLYGLLGISVLGIGVGFTLDVLPQLVVLVVGVVAVSVLASVVPAVRAGRVSPIRALLD
jgi:putative ABC transport system permease protein